MQILGSSNSAANKNMMSKYGEMGYNYLIEKTLWEKKKLHVTSNFFCSHVFKSCLLFMRQNEYYGVNGHEI